MRSLKWLWIVTLTNIALAVLLFLILRAMLLAVGALAAFALGWPLFVLLPLGAAIPAFQAANCKPGNVNLKRIDPMLDSPTRMSPFP